MTLEQDATHLLLGPVLLRLAGGLAFWAWSPRRNPAQESLFRANVEEFARSLNTEPPLYIPSIDSGIATEPGDCRYGEDGAIYTRVASCTHSSGATASTFRVDRSGGKTEPRLVAKEPHYKNQPELSTFAAAERLENESKALRRFQHVSNQPPATLLCILTRHIAS